MLRSHACSALTAAAAVVLPLAACGNDAGA